MVKQVAPPDDKKNISSLWTPENWAWFDSDRGFSQGRLKEVLALDDEEIGQLNTDFFAICKKHGCYKGMPMQLGEGADEEEVEKNVRARDAAVEEAIKKLCDDFPDSFTERQRRLAFKNWERTKNRAPRTANSSKTATNTPKKVKKDKLPITPKIEPAESDKALDLPSPSKRTVYSDITASDGNARYGPIYPKPEKPSIEEVMLSVDALDPVPTEPFGEFAERMHHFIANYTSPHVAVHFSRLQEAVESHFNLQLSDGWTIVCPVAPFFKIKVVNNDMSFQDAIYNHHTASFGEAAGSALFILMKTPDPDDANFLEIKETRRQQARDHAAKKHEEKMQWHGKQRSIRILQADPAATRITTGERPSKMRKKQDKVATNQDISDADSESEPIRQQFLRKETPKKKPAAPKKPAALKKAAASGTPALAAAYNKPNFGLPMRSSQTPIPSDELIHANASTPPLNDQYNSTLRPDMQDFIDDKDVVSGPGLHLPSSSDSGDDREHEPKERVHPDDRFAVTHIDVDEYDKTIAREAFGNLDDGPHSYGGQTTSDEGYVTTTEVITKDNITDNMTATKDVTDNNDTEMVDDGQHVDRPASTIKEEAENILLTSKKESWHRLNDSVSGAAEHIDKELFDRSAAFLGIDLDLFLDPKASVRFEHWHYWIIIYQLVPFCFAKFQQIDKLINGGIIGDLMGLGKSIEQMFSIWWNNEQRKMWEDIEACWAEGDTTRHFPEDAEIQTKGTQCPSQQKGKLPCPCVPGSDANLARPSEGIQEMLPPAGTVVDWLQKAEDYVDFDAAGIIPIVPYADQLKGDARYRKDGNRKWQKPTPEQIAEIINRRAHKETAPDFNFEDERPTADDLKYSVPAPKGLQKYLLIDSNSAGSIEKQKQTFKYRYSYEYNNYVKQKDGSMRRGIKEPTKEVFVDQPALPVCWIGVDEAHEARDKDTVLFQFIRGFVNNDITDAQASLYLYSGTPAANGPAQLQGMISTIYHLSQTDRTGAVPVDTDLWKDRPEMIDCIPINFKGLCKEFEASHADNDEQRSKARLEAVIERFTNVLHELMVRRTYDTVWSKKKLVDLPSHRQVKKKCSLGSKIVKALNGMYDQIKNGTLDRKHLTKFNFMREAKRHRIQCSYPALLDDDLLERMATWAGVEAISLDFGQVKQEFWHRDEGSDPYSFHIDEIATGSAKLEFMEETLKKQWDDDMNTAVFSVGPLQTWIAYHYFKKKKYNCVFIGAWHDMNQRNKLVKAFQNRKSGPPQVLFSTSAISGRGIELTKANVGIVMEPDFDICPIDQCVYRIYRYGQNNETTVYRLYDENVKLEKIMMEKDEAAKEFADIEKRAKKKPTK